MFFGTLVAGSISSQIKVFIAQPGLFLTTLGTAAPLTSIFFLNYVELNVRTCSLHRLLCRRLSPERLLCPPLHHSQPCNNNNHQSCVHACCHLVLSQEQVQSTGLKRHVLVMEGPGDPCAGYAVSVRTW